MQNPQSSSLEACIRSYVPGRMRLRHHALEHLAEPLCQMLHDQLMQLPGMLSVRINPRVGSLLLCWDRAILSSETLLQQGRQYWHMLMMLQTMPRDTSSQERTVSLADSTPRSSSLLQRVRQQFQTQGNRLLDQLAPYIARDVHKGARARRVTQNRLMLASLAISMGVLATSNKMVHTVAGSIFLGFLGIHLIQHKKVL